MAMVPLSFQEYICSLDPTTLPRVLRICSGVYFQGSVYEISGNECCLSTGDLLKVTAVELQKVICEDTETGHTMELPPTFKGLFQPAPAPGSHPALQGPTLKGDRQRGLTLHQVLGQWDGRPQPLLCPTIGHHVLLLHPVYEVLATMHLRRDAVRVPSTLEVEVEDVTGQAPHVSFARPLLLSDLLGMEGAMPTRAEVLEGPAGPAAFLSPWEPRLRPGQRLQLHGRSGARRVLASAPGTDRHFLVSSAYQGRFRRRPRQFAGVRELAAGLRPGRPLRVVVTQDCEGRGPDVPPLGVGDRLEARGLRGGGAGARLLCGRGEEEGERDEELLLPLDLGGAFVEEPCGGRCGLAELLAEPLPCLVRVVAPDPALERDALSSLPALRLEALLDEPFLVGSFCEAPDDGFELPARWLGCSVLLRAGPVRPAPPCTRRSRVEEITDTFYYRLLPQLPGGAAPPPPRPPKPAPAGTAPGARRPSDRGPAPPVPPLPALPAPSAPGPGRRGPPEDAGTEGDDDEHDYESVDDNMQKIIRKMQAIFPF